MDTNTLMREYRQLANKLKRTGVEEMRLRELRKALKREGAKPPTAIPSSASPIYPPRPRRKKTEWPRLLDAEVRPLRYKE